MNMYWSKNRAYMSEYLPSFHYLNKLQAFSIGLKNKMFDCKSSYPSNQHLFLKTFIEYSNDYAYSERTVTTSVQCLLHKIEQL